MLGACSDLVTVVSVGSAMEMREYPREISPWNARQERDEFDARRGGEARSKPRQILRGESL